MIGGDGREESFRARASVKLLACLRALSAALSLPLGDSRADRVAGCLGGVYHRVASRLPPPVPSSQLLTLSVFPRAPVRPGEPAPRIFSPSSCPLPCSWTLVRTGDSPPGRGATVSLIAPSLGVGRAGTDATFMANSTPSHGVLEPPASTVPALAPVVDPAPFSPFSTVNEGELVMVAPPVAPSRSSFPWSPGGAPKRSLYPLLPPAAVAVAVPGLSLGCSTLC